MHKVQSVRKSEYQGQLAELFDAPTQNTGQLIGLRCIPFWPLINAAHCPVRYAD